MHIGGLFVYPIKGCRGSSVTAMPLDARGPVDDRRFLVVTPDGTFMTQRDFPRMALIEPRLSAVATNGVLSPPRRLSLSAEGDITCELDVDPDGRRLTVTVWDDRCVAVDQGDVVAAWLSAFLGIPCRLVRLADDFTRLVSANYHVRPDDQVGFADGFPFLIIGEASLDDLNGRLARPVPMNRFRPNIVVAGAQPYAEDTWGRIRVGDVELAVVKPCGRCVVTTTDQATAVRADEPLRTLAGYRVREGKAMFGQNAIHLSRGTLHLGDAVIVTEKQVQHEAPRHP